MKISVIKVNGIKIGGSESGGKEEYYLIIVDLIVRMRYSALDFTHSAKYSMPYIMYPLTNSSYVCVICMYDISNIC